MSDRPQLVAFGEALLRYSVPEGQRISAAHEFAVHPAGAELNVAVNLANLGCSVRFVSALPDNPLGRLLLHRLGAHGLLVEGDVSAPGRMGVFYYEPGVPPRGGQVTYDRASSAFCRYPWDGYNWAETMGVNSVFLTSGITAALGLSAAAGVKSALQVAARQARMVAFDVNYRAKLWSPEAARETIVPLLEYVDCLFVSSGDAVRVLGAPNIPPEDMLAWMAHRFGLGMVAMVYNPANYSPSVRLQWRALIWRDGEIAHYDQPVGVTTVDRLGAGDAFASGVLWAWMNNKPLGELVHYGSAMMALKNTFHGDFCLATRQELERVVSRGGDSLDR